MITQWENSSWIWKFAGTETMALMITTLAAFGFAFLCAGLASSQSTLGYVELAASFGCIVLAVIGVARVFRRISAKAPASAPSAGRATI